MDPFHPIPVFDQISHGRCYCYPMDLPTYLNFVSYKLSSWVWPGNFTWLANSFSFVLVLQYISNQYARNICCHTKRLAENKREKFFAVVQIYHVLGAHLALQERSYKL